MIVMPMSNDAHELLGLLAYIYLEHNRPEKAVVLLQALYAVGLSNPREQITLALSLLRAGKPEAALEVLDRLALEGIQDAPCHLVRSQALHALERPAEAQASMRAYLRLRTQAPSDPAEHASPHLPQPNTAAPTLA